ncbi:MAG: hypothetical protein Ta2D_10330 [Rickettsiales bacterium]|nr:MAG: hypothetical protein Ta2D_10330 [Rickettsiales bacterium]
MQKIFFKTICIFVPSKKKRQYLRSYLHSYSFIALINSFLFPLSLRQKLLKKKLDKLFTDSFVIATANGLTDQLNIFLTAYRLNQQTNNKYKFIFFPKKQDEIKETFIQKFILFFKISFYQRKREKIRWNQRMCFKKFQS